ncbi:hypothetical protein F7R91_37170 [Streptomyces luteolifulvus]|uniref:Uncharacterized protein n=1 Tax=Streptomyces luteolifulvus TaxID=2615112 RepID=A0A643JQU5_9ACTN|nr:hypothetical protein [Streptomyces luteolifulvus]KAB1140168.1 hypothetical protein F7R91_37170 [Streptomyces luteolifulvus]
MLTQIANGDSRLSFWRRVREFAVPPSMIETATTRRLSGDWAGACAAAGVDLDLDLRSVARMHGRGLTAQVRSDLRHLAPDLLRWHMPRIGPDGLLRPGLTLSLARYDAAGGSRARPVDLVARTPPAWADAGQRISLALWDGSHSDAGAARHPHPHPNLRFRLDLHRHLWDARRTEELRSRSGADQLPADDSLGSLGWESELSRLVPEERRCAVDRWAAEAAILIHAEGRPAGSVLVRLGTARHRLVLDLVADGGEAVAGVGPPALRIASVSTDRGALELPALPDAATWVLPDLELLRAGLIDADRLHPLVAAALVPGHAPAAVPSRPPDPAGRPRVVECRGAQHRIGLVDGVLAPLDHDPAEIRREELLAALTGSPLPCLQAIDEAHRHPHCLSGVRERLDHGDTAGALAVVEGLLGPDALLRDGALRDELEAAALRRITYGLYRAGLIGPGPTSGRMLPGRGRPRVRGARRRHATFR